MGVAITGGAGTAKRDPRVDAAAGALAGTVARLIVGPLDVVKIRFQVQVEPIRRAALQAGATLPSHYTGFVNAFKTIVREEGIQVRAMRRPGPLGLSDWSSCNPGSRVRCTCPCAPCAVGLQGLWRGTVPGLLLTVPYTAVQFLALQQCKDAAAALGWTGRWRSAVADSAHAAIFLPAHTWCGPGCRPVLDAGVVGQRRAGRGGSHTGLLPL